MVFSIRNQNKGFSPVRAGAARIVDPSDEFQVAGAYNQDLFTGQAVKQVVSGNVEKLNAADDLVLGVFNGCWYVTSQGDTIFRPYWPASVAVQTGSVVKASIYAAEGLFQIDSDADTAFADIDLYYDIDPLTGTGGSTVTGRSDAQVKYSTKGGIDSNAMVRLVERSQQPGNVRLLIVKFIRPLFSGQIGG